ncbi:MAG TPA: hypothetical protein VNN73_21480 [Blastocatellia bacterium]|jgi:mono/diheme cytochrome c family protein|nr:hypothetical protein [Blastocatellia bacterium]
MNKKDLIFISIAVGVIGLFIFLSLIGKKPKPLNATDYHATVTAQTTRDECLACHAPEAAAPMPANHPQKGRWDDRKGTNCLVCHKPPARAAFILLPAYREGKSLWLNLLQK